MNEIVIIQEELINTSSRKSTFLEYFLVKLALMEIFLLDVLWKNLENVTIYISFIKY